MTVVVQLPPFADEIEETYSRVVHSYSETASRSWTVDRCANLLQKLKEVAEECSKENWDSEGASAISPSTLRFASLFATSIPHSIPDPEISASPRGELSFEWTQSPYRAVSAAISEDGQVHYAWLNGTESGHESF